MLSRAAWGEASLIRMDRAKKVYKSVRFHQTGPTLTSAHPVHQHAQISGFRFSFSFCLFSSCSSWLKFSSFFTSTSETFFCVTDLPLARTRVQSTLSSHCPLSFNQHHWLTSATLIIFPFRIKFREYWESNQGCWVGSKCATSVLCSLQPYETFRSTYIPDAS